MSDMTTEKDPFIERLFNIGAHFAFSKSRRHPSMSPYIFGVKNKVEIFDLEETKKKLEEAKKFVSKLASERKNILFVGGKNEARQAITRGSESIDMPYVSRRWVGGTLTNFPEIKKRIDRLEKLQDERDRGELGKYTKKERLMIDREIERLEYIFGGLLSLKELPGALFVVDTKQEKIAVDEAKRKGIPVIALMNSDCNLEDADYPILANDSSITSITFFVNEMIDTYKENLGAKKEESKEEKKEDK
ncbi:MAG: 30S ribosomal protein S2 [Candidatus Pacebacteria bacterium]|jgi:small subunit ribosomal protein S2|nr:30S ribosomal protein S2 [bacterium]MDP6527577.1 30S ribosomal protein S2 [Candidatus Paceibacterota bacterium]MDP6659839.1 30S ribosomal protein S2 [Candidatus Paceibacterota bacterium]|tara:strand:- start:36102 stop:36842 length:741 start_codon:yes stop_codon:yes gene_type:complete